MWFIGWSCWVCTLLESEEDIFLFDDGCEYPSCLEFNGFDEVLNATLISFPIKNHDYRAYELPYGTLKRNKCFYSHWSHARHDRVDSLTHCHVTSWPFCQTKTATLVALLLRESSYLYKSYSGFTFGRRVKKNRITLFCVLFMNPSVDLKENAGVWLTLLGP